MTWPALHEQEREQPAAFGPAEQQWTVGTDHLERTEYPKLHCSAFPTIARAAS